MNEQDQTTQKLREALKVTLSQYRLFVGPDDSIANAVIDLAEAALALREAAEVWKPIETAPKDGSEIILFCLPNEVPSLRPHIASGYWQDSKGFVKPGFWRFLHAVGPSFRPTHWMPLPPPPSEAATQSLETRDDDK